MQYWRNFAFKVAQRFFGGTCTQIENGREAMFARLEKNG